MNKSAFTLIELLVVMTIISILAAILVPVFAQVREKARISTCGSNMRQIAMGISQYTQDYDENMPPGTLTGKGCGWASQVYSYVKSANVFACPDDIGNPTAPNVVSSYAFNRNFTWSGHALGISHINSPAKTVMLFEVHGATADPTNPLDQNSVVGWGADGSGNGSYFGSAGSIYDACYGTTAVPCTNTLQEFGRHTGGQNFAMCDGHVKWMNARMVSRGMTAISGNGTGCTSASAENCNSPTNNVAAGSDFAGNASQPAFSATMGTM